MSSLLMKSCKFQATEEIFVTDIKTEDFIEETQNNDDDNNIIENVDLKGNMEKQVHIVIFHIFTFVQCAGGYIFIDDIFNVKIFIY